MAYLHLPTISLPLLKGSFRLPCMSASHSLVKWHWISDFGTLLEPELGALAPMEFKHNIIWGSIQPTFSVKFPTVLLFINSCSLSYTSSSQGLWCLKTKGEPLLFHYSFLSQSVGIFRFCWPGASVYFTFWWLEGGKKPILTCFCYSSLSDAFDQDLINETTLELADKISTEYQTPKLGAISKLIGSIRDPSKISLHTVCCGCQHTCSSKPRKLMSAKWGLKTHNMQSERNKQHRGGDQ